jgi:hypothetical protein
MDQVTRSEMGPIGGRYDSTGPGAVAKLDKAPVSKTGDSRFESWLPRFSLMPI